MEFPRQDNPVIIATKGLPYTRTLRIAQQISGWAKSPCFSLDHILEEVYEEGGYNADRRPSTKEEDERLRGIAFSRLCRPASFMLRSLPHTNFNCVVIESQLSSTKDLDRLIELSTENKDENPLKLVIIEVRLSHKDIWKSNVDVDDKKWYLPGSWVEVEEAIRDYDATAREWEDHYRLVSSHDPIPNLHLKRLVLDQYFDLRTREIVVSNSTTAGGKKEMEKRWSPFGNAVEYLLKEEAAPSIVVYSIWRNKYVEALLDGTSASPNVLCNKHGGDCTFKCTALVAGASGVSCRACDKHILEGEACYMCVSCSLALHKSCATFPPIDFYYDVNPEWQIKTFEGVLEKNPGMSVRACKSCSEFSYECGGCVFETHLKCRLLPTVVDNPHLHPHPLSLQFFLDREDEYTCELCALVAVNCGYYCVI